MHINSICYITSPCSQRNNRYNRTIKFLIHKLHYKTLIIYIHNHESITNIIFDIPIYPHDIRSPRIVKVLKVYLYKLSKFISNISWHLFWLKTKLKTFNMNSNWKVERGNIHWHCIITNNAPITTSCQRSNDIYSTLYKNLPQETIKTQIISH